MTEPLPSPGSRLRLARERLGLTQAQLAEVLRVTRGAVSAWESGLRRLEGPALVALQAVYGVSTTWLLTGAGPAEVEPGIAAAGTELIYPPLADSLEAWDSEGRIDVSRLPRAPWPIPAAQAQELLAGQGGVVDLIFLKGVPGLGPMLPPGTIHLMNVSRQARSTIDIWATYLLRSDRERRGLCARLRRESERLVAVSLDAMEPPAELPSGNPERVLLARVLLSAWRW